MVILLGYMGCGKSSVAHYLHQKHSLTYCDLDAYIEKQENQSIAEIFKLKGEIYFRKIENQYLKQLLQEQSFDIIALGGGTPCYADNMSLINKIKTIKSIYLKVNLETLTHRLFEQKHHRPLIADIADKHQLKDFIRKHLFEREFYYRKATEIIDVSEMGIESIADLVFDLGV